MSTIGSPSLTRQAKYVQCAKSKCKVVSAVERNSVTESERKCGGPAVEVRKQSGKRNKSDRLELTGDGVGNERRGKGFLLLHEGLGSYSSGETLLFAIV